MTTRCSTASPPRPRPLVAACAACGKHRDAHGAWRTPEPEPCEPPELTHGICPECLERLYPEYAERSGRSDREP